MLDLALSFLMNPPRTGRSVDERAMQILRRPARSTLEIVTVCTLLFYAAEKNVNPKVRTIWDASIYVTTCLSVGYADIFARTPVGKLVGSFLMTIGPALSNAALEGPHGEKADDAVEREILATLQQILARLPEPAAPGAGTDPATDAAHR